MTHFGDLGFWATDSMTSGPPPPGGQGFSMSTDEMRSLLSKATTLQDTISDQLGRVAVLYQAVPPANEPASRGAVLGPNGVNETGVYYEGHLRYQLEYLTELIARLNKALGITVETDRQAADTAQKHGAAE